MANKDLALFTKADLEKTLKSFIETFSQAPQKKLSCALNFSKEKYKDYPNRPDGPFINHVLRIPVWLIQNGITSFSVVIASFYRYAKEDAVEIAHSCYEAEIKKIIELIAEKDYSKIEKEERFDLRLGDFQKAVESSIEAGLILLSDYFDNRINFDTEQDDNKKIFWSKHNGPRIQIFLEKLLPEIKIKQENKLGQGIGLNVREISMILRKDLDLANQILQPV